MPDSYAANATESLMSGDPTRTYIAPRDSFVNGTPNAGACGGRRPGCRS